MGGTSGGHLLHLSVAGCVFNDLQREARRRGIRLHELTVKVDGAFAGEPLRSTGITYSIRIEGEASEDALRSLVASIDEIGEIPHVIRHGADVKLVAAEVRAMVGDDACLTGAE